MPHYTVMMDSGTVHTINAPNVGEALDEAVWEFGEEGNVLAVQESPSYRGPYRLVDTRGIMQAGEESYATLQDALREGADHDPVSIAIPDRRTQ